jgi:hypothetical protein
MRIALLLLVNAAALSAVDLTGEWRRHDGDDPRWASPDFDDRAWAIMELPRRVPIPNGVAWLRRTATAPPEAWPDPALAIGTVAPCVDVFINGQRIGGLECPATGEPPIRLPSAFPVPPALLRPGQPFTVALRIEGRSSMVSTSGVIRRLDEGPYLLTRMATAAAAARTAHLQLQVLNWRWAVLASLMLAMAVLMLALWLFHRESWELFLFGLFEALVGARYLLLLVQLASGLNLIPMTAAVNLLARPAIGAVSYLVFRWERVSWPSLAAVIALHAGSFWLPGNAGLFLHASLHLLFAIPGFRRQPWLAATFMVYSAGIMAQLLSLAVTSVVPLLNLLVGAVIALLLLIRVTQERGRLTAEIAAAQAVQQLLLSPPGTAAPFQIDCAYHPAREVGGDFYQAFETPAGTLVLAGDVSGKGLQAAMRVSTIIGALRNRRSDEPASLLQELNRVLLGGGGFTTCCCALFPTGGGPARVANAGHPAPYVDGREMDLEPALPLGVTAEAFYLETAVSGSMFTFVSDGVIEAANAAGELFGFERTREISARPAPEIAEAARAWGQNDDITVVTVRRNS